MSQVNIQGGAIAGIDKLETKVAGHTHLRGRVTGKVGISKRYELEYTPGVYGIPSALSDTTSSTEATNITCDRNFILTGTNAVTDDVLINAEGGITMSTRGADGDATILTPHTLTSISAWNTVTWGTDKEVEWECWIRTGSNITNAIIWAGLKKTSTPVVITDTDQVFFRYEDDVNSALWEAVSSIGGTDSQDDAAVAAVATSTQYHLKITIDDGRIARMYINDVLVKTTGQLDDTVDFKPYIGVEADGASDVKTLDVYGQAISRKAG